MPFDLHVFQNIFQMKMDQIIKWCFCFLCIHDDHSEFSQTEEEDDKNLLNLVRVTPMKLPCIQQQKNVLIIFAKSPFMEPYLALME